MRAPSFVCLCVLTLGCGRVHFEPADAHAGGPDAGADPRDARSELDAPIPPGLDAAQPDAAGADAGLDAFDLDAPGIDAPTTDAPTADAGSDAGSDAGPGIPLRCGDFVGPAFCETAPDATLPPRDSSRSSQGTIQPRVANGRMYLWSLAGSDRRLDVHRTDGSFIETIAPPPGYSGTEFGVALAALGDIVAVGAPTRNAVLVYRWTGATHAFVQEIVASPEILSMCRDGGGFTFFGRDVALEGQTLVTTARRCLVTFRTASLTAPAYAFVQRTAPDTTDANFGSSLEIAGGVAIMFFDASVLQVADVDTATGTFAYRLPRPPASYGGYVTHVAPSWICADDTLWVPFDPTASSGRSVPCTLDRYDLTRL
jgi:hypothetical protein